MIHNTIKNTILHIFITVLMALLILTAITFQTEKAYAATDPAFENYLSQEGFPESYKASLRLLHEKYPNWVFKSLKTGIDWTTALNAEAKSNVSLIHIYQPDAFKSVAQGDYNFEGKYYIGKDSSAWVSASRDAVGYYLDPRNWLNEKSIFMFEDLTYHPEYQTEAVVKKILSGTKLPADASSYFMKAATQQYNGQYYSVSPTHLASRVRQEIGDSTYVISGAPFTYLGQTYMGLYNPYNIGATSGSDAATKGLIYANGGLNGTILSTTYNRPWNTLERAVMGGALFICDGYINNRQDTNYLEKFNVANGTVNVGVHQYMTNIMAPSTEAITVYNNYQSYGILGEKLTFLIPVFDNMPQQPYKAPPTSGNNNFYLDSLSVDGFTLSKTFNRFNTEYTVSQTVSESVDSVNISAKPNASDATVSGAGKVYLKNGSNVFYVKVTSSSGKTLSYKITINRGQGGITPTPEVTLKNPTNFVTTLSGPSTVKMSWDKVIGATGYRIRYKRATSDKWYYVETATNSFEKKMATEGIKYQFKVRAFKVADGNKTYSPSYSAISEKATFGPTPAINGSLNGDSRTVKITWSDVTGATGYRIRYKRSPNTKWYYKDVTAPEFIRTMDQEGISYDFKMRPYAIYNGVKYYSFGYSNVISIKTEETTVEAPKNLTTKLIGPSTVRITWDSVENATGYKVYYKRKTSDRWYSIETTDNSLDKAMATEGILYQFKVSSFLEKDGQRIYSKEYSNISEKATFSEIKNYQGGLYKGYMTVRLSWDKVEGATGYRIRYKRSTNTGWYYKETTNLEFIRKMGKSGIGYDYKIRPYAIYEGVKYYYPDYSDVIKIYTLKKVDLQLTRKSKTEIFLDWNNISGESGYKVYRATSENGPFTMVKTISSKYSSWLDQGLSSGRQYYYKVRPYKSVNGNIVYGPYSVVHSI